MTRQALSSAPWRELAGEGSRYTVASALAFLLDFGTYVALIRLADVPYLIAAPAGFAIGLAAVYFFSIYWVFRTRRLQSASREFLLFGGIGLAGMGLNQLVVYGGVEWISLSYEWAKLVSAGVVFGFNFGARKLLLFTAR